MVVAREANPWFPPNDLRQVYYQLLDQGTADKATLKSTLVRRAMVDVQRVVELREQKPALAQLAKSGVVGDDIWNEFLLAENELEQELAEVAMEANELEPGWQKDIFQQASEMVRHERQKEAHQEADRQRKRAEKEKERREERDRLRQRREEERLHQERERIANELIKQDEKEKLTLSRRSSKKPQ